MNPNTLISVHGYAGDAHQIEILMPCYEHHKCPVYIVSPEDSKIEFMGAHSCLYAGLRGYVGQITWDRQHLQLKRLLDFPFDWYLLNDSDSFCLQSNLPSYLFEDKNTVYSNEVNDFRKPGGTWTDKNGSVTWPLDYHIGHPLVAMQPPYFCSREALQKIVAASEGMIACPITPFIDWWWVPACKLAGVHHQAFRDCVSCETETEMGLRLVGNKIREGAIFVHAVKREHAFNILIDIHKSNHQ